MTFPERMARQRPPQLRVLRNDARLFAAALATLVEDGWPALTFNRVAARAGLSRTPLYARFDTPSALAAALWWVRCWSPLQTAINDVLRAGGTTAAATPSPEDITAALTVFLRPPAELTAAAELLVIAQFDPALREAVGDTLAAEAVALCSPQARRTSRTVAARRAYLLGLALGLLLAARRPSAATLELEPIVTPLAAALAADVAPRALPMMSSLHLDAPVPFDTGDVTRDALLQAALDQIGEQGFDGASVSRIVTRAGSSQGALFVRYASKLDLFIDATRRQAAYGFQANADYERRIAAENSPGVAEAVAIREVQRPGRDRVRALNLEQFRVAWHNAAVSDATESELAALVSRLAENDSSWAGAAGVVQVHTQYALTYGLVALAQLCPDCWKLPYDVVTVPLLD